MNKTIEQPLKGAAVALAVASLVGCAADGIGNSVTSGVADVASSAADTASSAAMCRPGRVPGSGRFRYGTDKSLWRHRRRSS